MKENNAIYRFAFCSSFVRATLNKSTEASWTTL